MSPTPGDWCSPTASGSIRAEGNRIVLEADASDEESLARVKDVLGRHLERFGARRELTVHWSI